MSESNLITRFTQAQDRLEMLGWAVVLDGIVFKLHRANDPVDKCVALKTIDELLAFCDGLEAVSL